MVYWKRTICCLDVTHFICIAFVKQTSIYVILEAGLEDDIFVINPYSKIFLNVLLVHIRDLIWVNCY